MEKKAFDLNTLPVTDTVPAAGKLFFDADRQGSYRLARAGIIPVINVGTRNKRALMHVLARRLNSDPQDSTAA